MPVSPCICCDCCECTQEIIDELASSYIIDFSGTWDFSGCETSGCENPCAGSTDVLYLAEHNSGCDFGGDGFGFGDVCIGGYPVVLISLFWLCGWHIFISFYSPQGYCEGTVDGPEFLYRKTESRCSSDPTGTYEVVTAVGCVGGPNIYPATITVT